MSRALSASFAAGDRIALALEYEGSHFYGWQTQGQLRLPTVQETLEIALSRIAAQPIKTTCAGRTDTGVHASHQVVHFDTPVAREASAWVLGGNTHLPPSIVIKWVQRVAADFSARFSAVARRYRYVIFNRKLRTAHTPHLATLIHQPLDAVLMHNEAQCLIGEHDFSAFRGAGCQSKTPMRSVYKVEVLRSGDYVVVDIQANAFLLHMVRNIVGSLLAVGGGRKPIGWTAEIFAGRDRTRAAATAPPQGLYLVDVVYPAAYNLPPAEPGPAFLAPLWSY